MSHARRRALAKKRTADVLELDVRWAFRLNRLPLHAEAASICPCGRRSWLMPGATDEDWAGFRDDEDTHASYCEVA